jgi:hypothetical protein
VAVAATVAQTGAAARVVDSGHVCWDTDSSIDLLRLGVTPRPNATCTRSRTNTAYAAKPWTAVQKVQAGAVHAINECGRDS